MKSKLKIQQTLGNVLLLIVLAVAPHITAAQCPKAIICHPTRGLGLQFDAVPAITDGQNTYLDFGGGDSRTGYYRAQRYFFDADPLAIKTLFYDVNCSTGLNNLKITFNDKNHTYCGASNSCYDNIFYQNGAFYTGLLDGYLQKDLAGCKQWEGDCGVNGTIYRTGRVSIGKDYVNSAYMLAVSGKILTEQYKVQKCGNGWCDYVFDDDYKLLPLSEVEKAIQQNKHLPKTKSAEDIKKEEGIDAAETLLNHQEKIEEIFLHLIELDRQLNFPNIGNK